ncbi:MAG TPA: hypothetical protein DEB17_01970 [Chlorobaculum sp.]|uniref:Uncharacterized protein n=1 Tax=Chlorobaculum tepidum (strain ATCC 49652 / DSM 12025 / NBRC 103806 / TLS) TaxID=194439 RepID=Q8KDK1_CHLTE|nr:hypothetical protein CT1047 [Chlorobaculum tepidum TLS]HBU22766.1 hypothetical protein [Chlorobaculum sp.]
MLSIANSMQGQSSRSCLLPRPKRSARQAVQLRYLLAR